MKRRGFIVTSILGSIAAFLGIRPKKKNVCEWRHHQPLYEGEIPSIQPIDGPVGGIFYFDYKYGEDSLRRRYTKPIDKSLYGTFRISNNGGQDET